MQNKKRNLYRSDLRTPLLLCAIIGVVLLLGFLIVAYTVPRVERIRTYGFLLLAVYVLSVGMILPVHLKRYLRVCRADAEAERMTTEISDMFRYIADIPYAIVDESGTVKIVSAALQELLQIRVPVCNMPLASFCRVPISEVIAYAQNGGQVRDITFNEDGVPIDNTKPMIAEIDGKKFGMRCYTLRSRGTDYYFIVFNDITELEKLKQTMYENEPIVAYIVIAMNIQQSPLTHGY